MKIITISDTHTKHHQIPKKYLENKDNSISTIIHAGDISSLGYINEIVEFLDWYSKLPFTNKLFCPGNHDFYFEKASEEEIKTLLSKYPNITYLHDSGIEIDGIKFWGSGVTPWFFDWAFNRKGAEICQHWDLIPLDTDVLITHGPVKGYLDLTTRGDVTGCPYLLDTISRLTNLKLHVCGHIHEAYGRVEFPDGGVFINASVLNERYEMQNRPIEITLGQTTPILCGHIEK